jgi:hypothetical protein
LKGIKRFSSRHLTVVSEELGKQIWAGNRDGQGPPLVSWTSYRAIKASPGKRRVIANFVTLLAKFGDELLARLLAG